MAGSRSTLQKACLLWALMLALLVGWSALPPGWGPQRLGLVIDVLDAALYGDAALWALGAGLRSVGAAGRFALIFGLAFLGDGLSGLATGYGFLDLGVLTHASLGPSLDPARLIGSAPHLVLGGGILSVAILERLRRA